jgi:hypothetical protein
MLVVVLLQGHVCFLFYQFFPFLVVIFLIKKEEERRGIGVESSSHV